MPGNDESELRRALAERMWKEVLEQMPMNGLERVRATIDVLGGLSEPVLSRLQGCVDRIFMPNLPSAAWPNGHWFPRVAETLEQNFEPLRAEALSELNEGRFRPYGVYDGEPAIVLDGSPVGWDELRLWDEFKPTTAVLRLPVAARVTRSIVEHCSLVNAISFLAMQPGTRLPPHSDRANWLVSTHLGLVVPEGCGIRVGGETRTWPVGKCISFDNSYEHSAWNDSDSVRVIFAVHLGHPALTRAEAKAVKILQLRQMTLQAMGREAAAAWARSGA
ncbi:MAG TPA: aspartyl/asparaginyl beta-hydroxylase domain-containing protein [Labilithrix sp.]|nr:aspartyl/asparaginyl beta-hydroxylase domain-containing protein [Labilithrix sp.]